MIRPVSRYRTLSASAASAAVAGLAPLLDLEEVAAAFGEDVGRETVEEGGVDLCVTGCCGGVDTLGELVNGPLCLRVGLQRGQCPIDAALDPELAYAQGLLHDHRGSLPLG
jgi:hypothetical protein